MVSFWRYQNPDLPQDFLFGSRSYQETLHSRAHLPLQPGVCHLWHVATRLYQHPCAHVSNGVCRQSATPSYVKKWELSGMPRVRWLERLKLLNFYIWRSLTIILFNPKWRHGLQWSLKEGDVLCMYWTQQLWRTIHTLLTVVATSSRS